MKRNIESKKVKKIGSSYNDDNSEATSPSFGDDILYEILSRVPTKSLKQFKLVSKRWQSIIKDPNFGTLHFSRFEPTLDDTTLLIHPRDIRREDAGEIPILFSLNLFGGGTPVPFKVDLGLPLNQIFMLKPVHGLVCFVQGISVLIFNPCTGERTSWIKTTIFSSVGKRGDKKMSRDYSFGFGFDKTTKKHKVVCICEIFGESSLQTYHRVCGVLTVGENTWRKIDEVPRPYSLNLDRESLYVNGSIYWRDVRNSRSEVIVAFDVEREDFRVVKLSKKMRNEWACSGRLQSVHLIEVDGRMALLELVTYNFTRCRIVCWICRNDEFGYWDEYNIDPPFPWDGKRYLAFQAIEGRKLIILQSFYKPIKLESLYYFEKENDDKDRFKQVKITGMSSFPTPKFGYEIRTFVECLLPVQNQQT